MDRNQLKVKKFNKKVKIMTYIGYLEDRKNLGFSCIKDMESIPDFWLLTKDKKW